MIKTRMQPHCQRGALSLLGCAVLMAVISLAGIGALMSMRYERNLFAEAWQRLTMTPAVQSVRQVQGAVSSEAAPIRKCNINGQTVYSNIECDTKNPTSRRVELHDTRGIEAPKPVPVVESEQGSIEDLRHKAIERAISQ
jgi:hypothetical protein